MTRNAPSLARDLHLVNGTPPVRVYDGWGACRAAYVVRRVFEARTCLRVIAGYQNTLRDVDRARNYTSHYTQQNTPHSSS
jgi:hypothetical protein